MEIIPAIDILDGKCVRLTKGDFNLSKIYNENPVEVAKQFEDAGMRRVHLVDLDGAKDGKVKNWKVLENISRKTSLEIDFGGGIKTENDLKKIFDSGATWATVGSIAIKEEEKFVNWINEFKPENFLLAADVKKEEIMINAWQQESGINVFDFMEKYIQKGITQIFCTDISKDGLLQGSSVELYKKIIQKFPTIYFIASGGVSSCADIDELERIGCKAVIIGKAIYENKISLDQLKKFIN